ncbi:HD-GYP domain-containing protein [Deinococcus sonorensis]|uniref:HD-GYP domain-containing protein n=2 Tax=Deinococcus sonorensis TaxID=309891 RepID=A0AAU7U8A2_9DEIO
MILMRGAVHDQVPSRLAPWGAGASCGSLAPRWQLLLGRLTRLLEERDAETDRHTTRVTHLAQQFARRLNVPPERCRALGWGARLHDIGKLTVPMELLQKAGPLHAWEREVLCGHVWAGQCIAGALDGLPAAALTVIAEHHERWDGQGYPRGLRGEQISLEARLFSLCDVFDALTHQRSYKPAWGPTAALEEMRSQVGRQFDPGLFPVFEQLIHELYPGAWTTSQPD